MSTYRTGTESDSPLPSIIRTEIVKDGGVFSSAAHAEHQLVAVVVNGDQDLAERICTLLNGESTDERYERLMAANRKLVARLQALEDIEDERDRALGQLEDARRELARQP